MKKLLVCSLIVCNGQSMFANPLALRALASLQPLGQSARTIKTTTAWSPDSIARDKRDDENMRQALAGPMKDVEVSTQAVINMYNDGKRVTLHEIEKAVSDLIIKHSSRVISDPNWDAQHNTEEYAQENTTFSIVLVLKTKLPNLNANAKTSPCTSDSSASSTGC